MLGVTPAPRQKIDDYTLGGGTTEHRFNPYKDNGGTTAAIAGDDFAIIASDTRLTNGGYGIVSRNQSKLFQLNEKMVLGATGCWADVLTLTKLVEARIQVLFNHIAMKENFSDQPFHENFVLLLILCVVTLQ